MTRYHESYLQSFMLSITNNIKISIYLNLCIWISMIYIYTWDHIACTQNTSLYLIVKPNLFRY